MIFLKEFGRCAITSEKCPNCGQLTNTSFSRLVKDSCGHTKCRMCLLYEERGCKICQSNHSNQQKDGQDYPKPHIVSKELNEKQKLHIEDVLPLELVINKDSRSKEDQLDPVSMKSGSSNLNENNTFDNDKSYESSMGNITINDDSNKVYIPKIKYNMTSSSNNHLENYNNYDSKNSHVKNDNLAKTKVNEIFVEKSKNVQYRNRNHITMIPGSPEKYKCNVCNKIFRNKKGKCYHDACVTGIRPYQCNFCDKSFVKRSHFEYHERVHRGYKPYKCNLCEKAFPQQNKLNRHMFSHSKEKQFVCPECNKRYSKKDDLKNHLNVHNATAIYKCKSCDKSFCVLTNLKRHMQTHTSERPHRCDQCEKSFKDRSLLIRHKRTHGKERPFSCAHCNKVFLSKSELRRHLSVHSDEKPFSCEHCQTLFRRKDNLNRHIRHHHTENFSCEVRKESVIETGQMCPAKSSQRDKQKQTQKPKKTQPRSTSKITAFTSSRDQINSRLDSMGNITPVIRATNEVSNAVPVINGPINIRRLENRTDRKIFTYTKPIPIDEVVVLNRRIEEKLYPQTASNHNYFVRNYLKDKNSKINSHPNDKPTLQEADDFVMAASSQPETLLARTIVDHKNPAIDNYRERLASCEEEKSSRHEDKKEKEKRNCERNYEDSDSLSYPESNCVSTIKKHITQESEECSNENSAAGNLDATNHAILPKDFQNNHGKKQNDIHWRRRMAETLKPC